MSAGIPLVGIGLGSLLAAAGLTLWDGFQNIRGVTRAVRVVTWSTCGVLLLATLLLWSDGTHAHALALHLIPVAAIAVPFIGGHRSAWRDAAAMLPALVMITVALYAVTGPNRPDDASFELTFAQVVSIVFVGLTVRVIGEALGTQVDPVAPSSRLFDVLYLVFTLLIGGNALLTLWQRGSMWQGNDTELGLAGVWLIWSGAWLSPPRHPRLRAAFITGATLLLSLVVLGTV